ncbi:MAG: hypothetical protein AAF211_29195, partial [Myxococcota bacterium]
IATFAPGLHSNFAAPLSGRDFRLQLAALAAFQIDERTSIGFGFGYANLFGVPRGFPALRASIERDRWRLDALLPQELALWGELVDDRLSAGAKGFLRGGYYHRGTTDPLLPDRMFIRYSVASVGPALEAVFGPLRLTAEGGWSFFRRFEVYRDDVPLDEFDLAQGAYGRVELAVTPPQ